MHQDNEAEKIIEKKNIKMSTRQLKTKLRKREPGRRGCGATYEVEANSHESEHSMREPETRQREVVDGRPESRNFREVTNLRTTSWSQSANCDILGDIQGTDSQRDDNDNSEVIIGLSIICHL